MTRHHGAPMPEELRHFMRAGQHPARSVPCPHCGVGQHKPCVVPSRGRVLNQPHPHRISAWAKATACCPECQVEPNVPCHDEGMRRDTVHPRRQEEAKEAAA